MTDSRADLLGSKLTHAVDRLVAAFAMNEEQHEALGDLLAEVLGRVQDQSSQPFLLAWHRLEALERAIGGQDA